MSSSKYVKTAMAMMDELEEEVRGLGGTVRYVNPLRHPLEHDFLVKNEKGQLKVLIKNDIGTDKLCKIIEQIRAIIKNRT